MVDTAHKNQKPPPWEQDSADQKVSFGAWLRRERQIREISLREIADTTKIGIRYLEALEHDEFEILPAPVFARGFLRQYASYVGLDPDEVVNSYLIAQQASRRSEEDQLQVAHDRGRSRSWVPALLAVVALAVVLLAVAILSFRAERAETVSSGAPPIAAPPPFTPPQAEATPEPAAGPAAVDPAVPLVVTMDFLGECWVDALVDDGQRISELRVQGESLRLEAQREVVLSLGNVEGVRVEVNGRLLELDGLAQQSVVRDLRIDLETAERLSEGGR